MSSGDGELTRRGRLFITWYTCADGVDHAVTDEEFAAHRPEPAAVCGPVVRLAPMEASPGPLCPACWLTVQSAAAVVVSRHTLPDTARWSPTRPLRSVVSRLHDAIACRPFGWNRPRTTPDGTQVRPFRASSTAAAALMGDHPEPPTADRWPLVAAGDPAGEETTGTTFAPVSSPAQVVSSAVSVTGVRPAAQPRYPQSIDPGAVGAGLGGSQTAEATWSRPGVPPVSPTGVGTQQRRHTHPVVSPGRFPRPPRRDDHVPARRLVVVHPMPRPCPTRPGGAGLPVPERPEGAAPATPTALTVPAQR